MSAVLPADGALADALQKSEGVWHAAWRRFRADRVGLVSLVVVLGFIVLIVLSALGLVASQWQNEVGVANAPPTFMGPAVPQSTTAIEVPTGPNVDLSEVDPLAPQTRLYRSFLLDELGQDYVRTARAKGMTEGVVLFRHVLRNAMIPILTNIGLQLPGIFVGSFLIEVFFSIPGLGREVLLAVNRSDFPVIQAVTIYLAVLTIFINLLTDLAYKVADPRVVLK